MLGEEALKLVGCGPREEGVFTSPPEEGPVEGQILFCDLKMAYFGEF